MTHRRRLLVSLLACMAIVAGTLVSCYQITLVQQSHSVVKGNVFSGKLVIKDTGSTLGGVYHVYGLFGIRVPVGWEVDGKMVMTQVAKTTTDVGDPDYNHDIRRTLVASQDYTDLLNRCYPRKGYQWLGFVTESDFKTLLGGEEPDKRIDSIYVKFDIATSYDHTGVYYLDYVAGQISHDKLDQLGTVERDWATRVATFAADSISNVFITNTAIRVTNTDGTTDEPGDELWATPEEWELEAMPSSTYAGTARAYRDLKYNRLFTRSRGWNGGDGVLTVGLPGGDVFWTFNDSFYGIVYERNRNRPSGKNSFPRNSIMVQKAHDGVPGETAQDLVWLADYVDWTHQASDKYFNARTHLRHPGGEKTDEQIAAGEIDQGKVYWSGDGTVHDGKLQMIWIGVESAELLNLDAALATYSLEGNEPEGYYLNTIPDYLPHEGDYLYRESCTPNKQIGPCAYGSTLWEDADGHTYLYAVENMATVVARSQTHDLYSPWQYYVKGSDGTWHWQDDYPTEAERRRSGIMASTDYAIMLPWIFKEGDWYYMTSQAPIFSPDVYIYRSKSPYGPFGERKLLFRLPSSLDKMGPQKYHWLYMVNLHPALSRQGELVFSTNSDPDDFWMNFDDKGSADYYRPFFYRVFDWKKVYDDYAAQGVDVPLAQPVRRDAPIYNLQGQRVDHPCRGLYIKNGRKVFIE
ncbi:MAG: DUF5005 domain-containing protein [Prevotella sp.]|nr:DUF5005 domain-containing protein [Prevotella sp.]